MTDALTVTNETTEVVAQNATTTLVVASTTEGATVVEQYQALDVAAPAQVVVVVNAPGSGGAYDPLGAADDAVAAHEAASDPHPQYLTPAEGAATFVALASFTWPNLGGKPTTLAGYGITDAIPSSQKGAANGVAPLGSDSKIAAAYLPAYVDDVLEYVNQAAFPATGTAGVLYVAINSGTSADPSRAYRWSGSAYVEISPSPGSTDAVPEGATNLYFTNARAQAAVTTITGNAGTATKLQTARTFAITGKATAAAVSFDGSGNVSLNVTAVSLAASDIPSLDWSKIATGIPTTVSGFGITDAVDLSTNQTIGGTKTFSAAAILAGGTYFNGAAATARRLGFRTAGSQRWDIGADGTAESGSNAGTAFVLNAFDDAGVSLGSVFSVTRATRILAFTVSPTAPTPTAGDNSTKLATTAFITGALASYVTTANFTFANLGGKPTTLAGYGITDAVASSAFTWANLGSKPTTLSGFGITDAVNLSSAQTITGAKAFGARVDVTVNAEGLRLGAAGAAQSHFAHDTNGWWGTNTYYNSGWLVDDATKPAFVVMQHVANDRWEWRHTPAGGSQTTVATLTGAGLFNAIGGLQSNGNAVWHAGNFTPSNYVATSTVNAANGVAGLDASGKLNPAQLPALAITDTFPVASEAEMLALTADVGDVAVRSDESKSYILRASPASTLANWQQLLSPTAAVSSVFGRTGAITAQANDYTFAQIGSKPTTLSGYGITDAVASAAFTWSNLGSKPTTISGFGITDAVDVSTTQNIGGTKTFTGTVSIGGSTVGSNVGVELGGTNGTATTPFVDFHSGATATDYDARIIASGGNGASGGGTLRLIATNLYAGAAGTNSLWHSGNFDPTSKMDAAGGTFGAGIAFTQTIASSVTDLAKQIQLWAGYGFSITSSRLNVVAASNASVYFNFGGADAFRVNAAGVVPQLQTITSAATITPAAGDDMVKATALAVAATIAAPSGTPNEGWGFVIRLKDNGTARALTWNAIYRAATGVTLPTTTTVGKTTYVACVYNTTDTKVDVVSVAQV
jgi:hypothetical protein